jgi:cytochrome c-type biogenesis protein
MEFFYSLLDNTSMPVLTAFILGIMTAISPCPLATNITATAYISKEISNKRKIFYNGLLYTSGRIISYSALGIIMFLGAGVFETGDFFSTWGERFLGPMLLIIGIFMSGLIKINLSIFKGKSLTGSFTERSKPGNPWNALLLGIIFALAFCPYSGVLYFGMLIPITLGSVQGLLLPPVFALATGLPVIIIAYLLAFSISGIGGFYNKVKTFEKWFRKVVAVVFVLAGIYYIYIVYVNV